MSSNTDLSSPVRIAHGYRLQWEEAQDCHVLLYPEGMIKMNGSAGEIMSRLKDDSTMQSVIDELKSAFPDADLEQDVIKFLEEARDTVNPPLWLLAELTYKCPLQCPYCSNPLDFADYKAELNTEEWFRVLEQARKLGAVQLGLSGGEPLVRKDLEAIVERGHELGFYTNLITSGIGLTAERIGRLKSLGLDHIQISFQAGDQVLNDMMAGTDAFQHKQAMVPALMLIR